MALNKKRRIISEVLIGLAIFTAIVLGITLGLGFATMRNLDIRRDFEEYEPALPTQILDRNGNLITEIFADEKRDIVPLGELPKHLIYALISREDADFFTHNGVSLPQFFRAAFNIVTGRYFSGFSTLTMQVAGAHYADRTEISITRKLKEVWYAFQMEKALTKNEILEIYLNEVYFGHNAYGVESASQFYFGHSAREMTVAESAILVIQLASPALYSPINHPETARDRQLYVLTQMIDAGQISQEEADESFAEYWNSYDYERSNIASAYFDNNSKAPYFTEYVRLQLNDMLFGAVDINKDGFVVHTTLDLNYQKIAEETMEWGYADINQRYQNTSTERLDIVDDEYVPIIELLSLAFNIEDITISGSKEKKEAEAVYYDEINPALNMMGMMLGFSDLTKLTKTGFSKDDEQSKKTTVEGALITLENNTGHILAMVGGSDFETKQYNRAVDATLQPGSNFKPFYYSAAISNRVMTPATRIYDGPIVFYDEDSEKAYEPLNYLGEWSGSVRMRFALATSMNVPSLQVLDAVGFQPAIDRASRLLGMEDQKNNEVLFPHGYALGLGVTATAPINVARAFATFPSQGKEVEPIAIISVSDREGNIILEPEKERLREKQKREQNDQIMTPQEAYVMVDMLKSTVEYGTLANRRRYVDGFDGMPMAGKTGTTQNWQDAWTSGFSPYVTTSVWFGFDTPGISMGRYLTGATAAGPVWAVYMKKIHKNLEPIEFTKPETGLITMRVCSESGLLPTNECPSTVNELFLTGTEPRRACDVHPFENQRDEELLRKMQSSILIEDIPLFEMNLPTIPDLDIPGFENYSNSNNGRTDFDDNGDDNYNPLLDEDNISSDVNPLLD
ncbi:MAG: PBP1A family penicillin-binding protein [Spirochaetales bacterium]|nr:PBP1A family penicillin-binding protein [Spirochaetales bacterium]